MQEDRPAKERVGMILFGWHGRVSSLGLTTLTHTTVSQSLSKPLPLRCAIGASFPRGSPEVAPRVFGLDSVDFQRVYSCHTSAPFMYRGRCLDENRDH